MQKGELENVDEGHGRTVAVSKGPRDGSGERIDRGPVTRTIVSIKIKRQKNLNIDRLNRTKQDQRG